MGISFYKFITWLLRSIPKMAKWWVEFNQNLIESVMVRVFNLLRKVANISGYGYYIKEVNKAIFYRWCNCSPNHRMISLSEEISVAYWLKLHLSKAWNEKLHSGVDWDFPFVYLYFLNKLRIVVCMIILRMCKIINV